MVKPGQPLTIDGKPHPTESPPPHWNWQPPRNIINLDRLPPLPLLVDYACWALFSDANIQRGYRDAHQPSGHSLQSLAFLGDSLLQAAATKALMGVTAPAYRSCLGDLTTVRNSLVGNAEFSHLALIYRLNQPFTPHSNHSNQQSKTCDRSIKQKRAADIFEAYIGAAYASSSSLDLAHNQPRTRTGTETIGAIDQYLQELFSIEIWNCLRVLQGWDAQGPLPSPIASQILTSGGLSAEDVKETLGDVISLLHAETSHGVVCGGKSGGVEEGMTLYMLRVKLGVAVGEPKRLMEWFERGR